MSFHLLYQICRIAYLSVTIALRIVVILDNLIRLWRRHRAKTEVPTPGALAAS